MLGLNKLTGAKCIQITNPKQERYEQQKQSQD